MVSEKNDENFMSARADFSQIVLVLHPRRLGRQTQEMVCVLSRRRDSPRPREGETAAPPSSENEIDAFSLFQKAIIYLIQDSAGQKKVCLGAWGVVALF